ncbi:MAG: DoxX family protein [Fidelibacterota bacterium]
MQWLTTIGQLSDWGLLALRAGIGAIFLVHGRMKWAMWKMEPSEQMPPQMLTLMKFLSVVEPLGGAAVLVGFLTQLAAVGLGVIMVGAIFSKIRMMNAPFVAQDKTGWELDFIILAACIALLFAGAGEMAVDRVLFGL